MSAYVGVLFVHVASAVLLLGTSIVGEPVVRAMARRAESAREVRTYLGIGHRMAAMSPPAALMVLVTGAYLATAGRSWTLGWVQVSAALWLVNSFLAAVVVKSAIQQVSEEAADRADDDVPAEQAVGPVLNRLRWSAGWTWGGDLLAVNDAVMLYVMVVKPTLAGSVAMLILSWTLVAGARIGFGLHHPPRLERARGMGLSA